MLLIVLSACDSQNNAYNYDLDENANDTLNYKITSNEVLAIKVIIHK